MSYSLGQGVLLQHITPKLNTSATVPGGQGGADGDTPLGNDVGDTLSTDVGAALPATVGDALGTDVGDALPATVGDTLGTDVGDALPATVGDALGTDVGAALPANVGDALGSDLGNLRGALGRAVLGFFVDFVLGFV